MTLTDSQRLDLMRRVALMAEALNRTLSDELLTFWAEELAPHYGPDLFAAIRESMREKWMPSVNEVLARVHHAQRQRRKEIGDREHQRALEAYAGPRLLPETTTSPDEAARRWRELRAKLGLADDESTESH